MEAPISSRGCCRVYICYVLYRALLYTKNMRESGDKLSFPFPSDQVSLWLLQAKGDCADESFLTELIGGTPYKSYDKTSYWTTALQFNTWWKNNIERKAKFAALNADMDPFDSTKSSAQRALYCQIVVGIANSIRKICSRGKFTQTPSTNIPYELEILSVINRFTTCTAFSGNISYSMPNNTQFDQKKRKRNQNDSQLVQKLDDYKLPCIQCCFAQESVYLDGIINCTCTKASEFNSYDRFSNSSISSAVDFQEIEYADFDYNDESDWINNLYPQTLVHTEYNEDWASLT